MAGTAPPIGAETERLWLGQYALVAREWVFADAWFLDAVGHAEGPDGASLSEVIATGDAINHAIFTRGEIEHAVSQLSGAGLLIVTDDRFALTAAARSLRERSPSKGLFGQVEWLSKAIRRIPVGDTGTWQLDGPSLEAAFTRYKKRFAAKLRRLEAEDQDDA